MENAKNAKKTSAKDTKSATAKTAKKKKGVKVSTKLEKIIEQVEKLSVLELADLVKALEDKFGVSTQATVTVTEPSSGKSDEPGSKPAEEKSEFDLILADAGANKIAVIKAVREVKPELGLKDAKDLVEAAPKELLAGIKKEEAEAAKKKLEEAGAQVELK